METETPKPDIDTSINTSVETKAESPSKPVETQGIESLAEHPMLNQVTARIVENSSRFLRNNKDQQYQDLQKELKTISDKAKLETPTNNPTESPERRKALLVAKQLELDKGANRYGPSAESPLAQLVETVRKAEAAIAKRVLESLPTEHKNALSPEVKKFVSDAIHKRVLESMTGDDPRIPNPKSMEAYADLSKENLSWFTKTAWRLDARVESISQAVTNDILAEDTRLLQERLKNS